MYSTIDLHAHAQSMSITLHINLYTIVIIANNVSVTYSLSDTEHHYNLASTLNITTAPLLLFNDCDVIDAINACNDAQDVVHC